MNKLEAQSLQTKKRILDAADRLFFSNGYQATGVEDVCALAGVTKGAFYHHFKNKEAVYRRLFIPKLDNYLDAHYALSDAPTAHERFLKLAQCTFASSVACGRELVAQNTIGMLTDRVSELYVEDRTHTRLLRAACEAAVAEGLFPEDTTVEMLIMLYSCMMTGFLTKWSSATEADDRRIDWDALLVMEFRYFGG